MDPLLQGCLRPFRMNDTSFEMGMCNLNQQRQRNILASPFFFQQSYKSANNSPELSEHHNAKAVPMYYPDGICNCKEDQLSQETNRGGEMHSSKYYSFLNSHKLILGFNFYKEVFSPYEKRNSNPLYWMQVPSQIDTFFKGMY